jgi:hypothetical protein
MPLVTLKYREEVFGRHSTLIGVFALNLPGLLIENSDKLFLEEGTTPDDVQVDVMTFNEKSVNIPDIWLFLLFTEDVDDLSKEQRQAVALEMRKIITNWLKLAKDMFGADIHVPAAKVSIDIFWGPGHGCMVDNNGKVTKEW